MACAAVLAAVAPALAAEPKLHGTFGDKAAVVSVDGGSPRTVRVGERLGALTLLAVEGDRALVEWEGRRLVLVSSPAAAAAGASDGRRRATLTADARGHFYAEGAINGVPVRFLVDTGASAVALSGREAARLGLDYRKGASAVAMTAAGPVRAWRVVLDRVRVGEIELHQVDAAVIEQGPEVALLGMSFLNRVDMRRDGERMTLMRRF